MNGERMENSEEESEEMYDWEEEEGQQDEEGNGKGSQDLSSTSEPVSQVGAKKYFGSFAKCHIISQCWFLSYLNIFNHA